MDRRPSARPSRGAGSDRAATTNSAGDQDSAGTVSRGRAVDRCAPAPSAPHPGSCSRSISNPSPTSTIRRIGSSRPADRPRRRPRASARTVTRRFRRDWRPLLMRPQRRTPSCMTLTRVRGYGVRALERDRLRAGRSPGADGSSLRCSIRDSALAKANPSCADPPCDLTATAFSYATPEVFARVAAEHEDLDETAEALCGWWGCRAASFRKTWPSCSCAEPATLASPPAGC